MSSSEIARVPATAPLMDADAVHPSSDHSPQLLRQLQPLLRGRYWLAGLLTLAGLALGAYLGFISQSPYYRSTGIIRVRPYLPRILYENEQNGVMPMFDAFVGSQVELMRGQRVVDLAMQDTDWTALGRGLGPDRVMAFREGLSVARPKGSELILISFEDKDPEVARLGVKAVIGAYEKLYSEQGGEGVDERIRFLEQYDATLTAQLKALNDRIFAIADELGSGALEQIYTFKLSELNKLETELRRAELEVAIARGAEAALAGTALPNSLAPPPVTAEALAMQVPEVRNLLASRRELELQLKSDGERLGPRHKEIIRLQAQLSAVEDQIQEAMLVYQRLGFGRTGSNNELLSSGDPAPTLAQLEAGERNVRKLYEDAKRETQDLGRKSVQIDLLRTEANDVRGKLEDTKRRLEALTVERNLGGRISVESTGERPLSPARDKRAQFAAAGAVGMGGSGLALVLLLGLIDRRVRSVSDLRERVPMRLLGVLPQLPTSLSDPEHALLAAHGVHQIRTALQGPTGNARKVFAITSPSPGAGKTSLSLALGLSFAASRARTLMIDCDYLGGGLTAKFDKAARYRLGHLLRRSEAITEAELSEGLEAAKREQQPLGEALVRLGHVTRQQVEEALAAQRESLIGLREAINGDPAEECIVETGAKDLYLMPLGSGAHQNLGELSFSALEAVVEQVRRKFDVIVIDTGPVPGSLEASLVAMVADDVVLTVARGEQRGRVAQALEHLAAAGANVAGVVLNRATSLDFRVSGYSSSIGRHSGGSVPKLTRRLGPTNHKDLSLGPIGTAVAALAEFPPDALRN